MEKTNITLAFAQENVDALELYLKKEKTTAPGRLEEALAQLYEQAVPEPVLEYLDRQTAPPPRPKRPSRPAPKEQPAPSGQEQEGGV